MVELARTPDSTPLPDSGARVLLLAPGTADEVLLTTPVLRALRKAWPTAHVIYLAEPPCNEVLRHNPHVGEVWDYPASSAALPYLRLAHRIRQAHVDVVLDLSSTSTTARLTQWSGARFRVGQAGPGRGHAYTHALAAHREPLYPVLRHGQLLAALGLSLDGLQLELHLTAAERAQAAAALAQAGRREQAPLVAMAPAAEEADKVWPPERYAQVADALVELTGAQILLLGAGPEQPWLEAVRACMRLAPLPPVPVPDLRHAAALLERATLYLGADTVTRHMAMALDLPSVTIVGRADPRVGTPPGQMAHVALAYDPGCKARCTFPHCLHLSCVATIPAESVLRAALRALGIAEPGARPAPWPAAAGAGQRERLPLAR